MKRKCTVLITMVLSAAMLFTGCRHVFVKNPASNSGGVISIPTVNTTAATAFSAVGVRKIGNHTYIPVDFYNLRSRDSSEEKVIEACLEEADKSLARDIYVNGIGGAMTPGEYRLFAWACEQGAVLEDIRFCATRENTPLYTWYQNDLTIPEPEIDTTGVIPATYILKFGILEGLYYEFTINEYSTIKVDAHNGQVITKNFWDGVYVD